MKFFAIIDDRQVGPFTLGEILESGVRPSTYVWHKGMEDWQKAEDVPEICRAMRRALAGFDPLTGELPAPIGIRPEELQKQSGQQDEMAARAEGLRGIRGLPEPQGNPNFDVRPQGVSVILAIITTVMCFPFTGLVAIWYAMKCNAHWKMSLQEGLNPQEAADLRRKAHDDARIYRMMIGITFFLGIMMIGFTMSQMFFK